MPARVVIDRDAFAERYAILAVEGMDETQAMQLASLSGYNTAFSLAATAAANGDWEPAKELCRRERSVHGQDWAMELWREIERVVKEEI